MTQVYGYSNGLLPCFDSGCHNEAKWVSAYTMTNVEGMSDEARGDAIRRAARCGVHQRETMWSERRQALLPSDRALAIEAGLRYEIRSREEGARRANAEHDRQRNLAVAYWVEVDREPEYTTVVGQDYKGRRTWRVLPVSDNPHVYEVVTIALDDSTYHEDVTFPAKLSISISSSLTPKLALVYARALMEASVAAMVMNEMTLRPKHNAEAARLNDDTNS